MTSSGFLSSMPHVAYFRIFRGAGGQFWHVGCTGGLYTLYRHGFSICNVYTYTQTPYIDMVLVSADMSTRVYAYP